MLVAGRLSVLRRDCHGGDDQQPIWPCGPFDTLDTVDTLAISARPEPQSVKSVQSVRGRRRLHRAGLGFPPGSGGMRSEHYAAAGTLAFPRFHGQCYAAEAAAWKAAIFCSGVM